MTSLQSGMLFFTATETSDVVYQLRMSCELGEATNVPQVRAFSHAPQPKSWPVLYVVPSLSLALFVALVSRTHLLQLACVDVLFPRNTLATP